MEVAAFAVGHVGLLCPDAANAPPLQTAQYCLPSGLGLDGSIFGQPPDSLCAIRRRQESGPAVRTDSLVEDTVRCEPLSVVSTG